MSRKNRRVVVYGDGPFDDESLTSVQARFIDHLFSAGNWFMFPKMFLQIMSPDEALLLAYLINISQMCRAEDRKRDSERWKGWFYRKLDQVEQDLQIKERRQQRILVKLERKKLILRERRGSPAKRYFKINTDAIIRKWEKVQIRQK